MKRILILMAATALAASLPDSLRLELAMTQRDLREVERNFLDLRLQFDNESRKLMEKSNTLVAKFKELQAKATEICKEQGGEFDENKLECVKKNESNNQSGTTR